MSIADGRGSGPQRFLYGLLKEIYPLYDVVYEQPIPQLGQRIDLFIKELGIAVEYDGRQHTEYVDFFHKDVGGYIKGMKMDRYKEEFLAENGIKIIRLSGDVSGMTPSELKGVIDKEEYPDSDYDKNCFVVENRQLKAARDYRKEQYQRTKESISKTTQG